MTSKQSDKWDDIHLGQSETNTVGTKHDICKRIIFQTTLTHSPSPRTLFLALKKKGKLSSLILRPDPVI